MTQFTCDCMKGKGAYRTPGTCQEHSILVTETGLRMVTRKQWFQAMGIPSPARNMAKAQLWFAENMGRAKVKWADQTEVK